MNNLFNVRNSKLVLVVICSLYLVACSELSLRYINSENHNDRIRYLIIHYTTIDYQKSVDVLTEENGVSAHYLIPESNDESYHQGKIEAVQLVDEQKRAWHAGRSFWHGQKNLNDQSIGIELVYKAPCIKPSTSYKKQITLQSATPNSDISGNQVNKIAKGLNIDAASDRICFYPDFDPNQIDVLIALIKDIQKRNPEITPERIVGHADITPSRRVDPGPKFPWYKLYQSGIGAWYEEQTVAKYWQQFRQQMPSIRIAQSALRTYGYDVDISGVLDAETINAITVFQMHFRPWQVNGKFSPQTLATLFALIEKYRTDSISSLLQQYQQLQNLNTETKPEYNGQFDGHFPRQKQSKRALVNGRQLFRSYQNQGRMSIQNHGASSAEIAINGKTLPVKFAQDKELSFDLSDYTQNGYNTLKVKNILPVDASITIDIPFPRLSSGKASDVGFDTNKLKKIDALIETEIKQGFPGATLLIAKQGKIIKHRSYGFSNRYDRNGNVLAAATKMQKNTLFDLASNTKMFATNYAIMKLARENKINIGYPISYYLPEYRGGGREERLVKDLLNHSAGYPPVVDFHDKQNQLGGSFFSQNKSDSQRLLIERVPFSRKRGIKSVYSDVDYMLLGTLIERISKRPLDQYVEEEIYQPLGLKNTLFNPLLKQISKNRIAATELQGNTRQSQITFDNIRTDVIQGEVHDEKAFYSMQGVAGHAGLFSTAKETAILASVILNRGGYGDVRLFDKSQMDQFLKPSDLNITMGLGWRRAGNGERKWQFGPYASPYAIGHTGWTGTLTIIDPYYDLIIVLLTNKKHSKMIDDPLAENDGLKHPLVFAGDTFETGKYGSIVSLIYEAFLEK